MSNHGWIPHPGGAGEYRVTDLGVEYRRYCQPTLTPEAALAVLWFVTLQHATAEIPPESRARVAGAVPLAAIDDVLVLFQRLGVDLPAPMPELLAPPAANEPH